MSAAVENGMDASRKPRGGVFSQAFAKRAQPLEEGESDDRSGPLVTPGEGITRDSPLLLRGEDKHRMCELSSLLSAVRSFCRKFVALTRTYLENGINQVKHTPRHVFQFVI